MVLKYTFIVLLLQLTVLTGNAQEEDAVLLQQAYKTGNTQKLYQFCINWQNEYPAISNNELSNLNDTLKEAYSLFSEFWNNRYTSQTLSQPGAPFKRDSSFLIVQNNLKIYISDHRLYFSQHQIDSFILTQVAAYLPDSVKKKFYASDNELDSLIVNSSLLGKKANASPIGILRTYRDNISPYSSSTKQRLLAELTDFRPRLNPDIHWLYWSKSKYEQISQLKNNASKKQKSDPFNAGNVFTFLKKYLLFIPGYMPNKPQPNEVYYVFPQTLNCVPSITFDNKLEYALVSFSSFLSGQTDIWHKENGQWQFVTTISRYMGQE